MPRPVMHNTFAFVLLFYAWRAVGICYYPRGEEAGDFPCNPEAESSDCCGGDVGTVCLSNGLCRSGAGNLIRGSCTNENWEGCAHFCLGGAGIGPDLISCANITNDATSYCCDHTDRCCESGVGRFTVLPLNPITTATWNRLSTRFVAIATPSSSASSSSATSQLTTTTSSSSGETSPPSTASSKSVTPITTSQSPQATLTTLSTGAQAGIGIGAGVGAILIAALIYVLWKLRKTEKALSRNLRIETEHASNNLGLQPVMCERYMGPPQELDARENIYIPELGSK